MKWIINRILSKISPKKLARMAWRAGKPKLEAYVKSTENDFDDEALEIISAIIEGLLEEEV